MGSVSGLTAFSLVFLSLAMLIFWAVTDIGGNEVVEQQLLKFQAKEIANDIELVSDYQNEGFAEVALPANYTFGISNAGGSSPGPYILSMELAGNKQKADLNVQVEDQNRPGNSMANFTTQMLCIYTDYKDRDLTRYNYLTTASFPGVPDPEDTYLGDVYDPEDSDSRDGSVENDDIHVQFYPGGCLS